VLALSLFGPGLRSVLVFCFAHPRVGVGMVEQRPHGQPANSFVQKLRKEIENGRITAFEQPNLSTLAVALTRSEQALRVCCDFQSMQIRLERAGDQRAPVTMSTGTARTGKPVAVLWPESVEALTAAGPELLADQASAALDDQRTQLDRVLRTAQKRLQKRLIALDEDSARAEQAGPLRTRGTLLLAQEKLIKRGQTSAKIVDYTVDPPAEIAVTLDPARTLKEQIESWFKQARRFERGALMAQERSRATRAELEQLEAWRSQAQTADPDELASIADNARTAGVRGLGALAQSGQTSTRGRRRPYREFQGHKERTILVGKGASDNDELTRTYARPQDLWLHVRDHSGAHVVVPLEKNEVCPEELLLDAAHLAAHFSSIRGEVQAEVSYTPKRYVRKPRGAAAGKVQLEREKVLQLKLEPQRLQKLLAHERAD
jgi:predicted ribosome quality control (RQC) complex YloA/Tae2 family protein